MDNYIRCNSGKRLPQIACNIDEVRLGNMDRGKRFDERSGFGYRTPADEELDIGITGKATGNIASKVSIAANDQDACYHVGLETISQKTMTSPPNAGHPSANHHPNSRLYAASQNCSPLARASSMAFIRI